MFIWLKTICRVTVAAVSRNASELARCAVGRTLVIRARGLRGHLKEHEVRDSRLDIADVAAVVVQDEIPARVLREVNDHVVALGGRR